jgi:hypothetical protein
MVPKPRSNKMLLARHKPVLSYSFLENGSYYEGSGVYRDYFDDLRKRFPSSPNRDNTSHHQNVLAIVASMYTHFHEDGTHPYKWFKMYSGMYSIEPTVFDELDFVLRMSCRMNENCVRLKLDMLLDIAIFYAYHLKSTSWLIDRLHIVGN